MIEGTPTRYDLVASQILEMPDLAQAWRSDSVCSDPPDLVKNIEGLVPDEAEGAQRNAIERRFIARVCGRCSVQRECFIDGVRTESPGAVRGGQTSREMARYVKAYKVGVRMRDNAERLKLRQAELALREKSLD